MAENKSFKNSKAIHKVANRSLMVIFEDMTNSTWNINNRDEDGNKLRNNVIIKFIKFNQNNSREQIIPIFVDADELMAVMNSIRQGLFSKYYNPYKNYGGSRSGISKKRDNGEEVNIVNGPESRIFSITVDDAVYLNASVFNGSVTNGGAIKPTGDVVAKLYMKMNTETTLIMAEAVYSYLLARKTICLSNASK